MATHIDMTREIRVDVLGANPQAFLLYRGTAPAGVKIGPLRSEVMNTVSAREVALYFLVTIQFVQPFVQDVAKDAAKKLAVDWFVDFISKIKAKRIRIDGHEPKDQFELERIASEKIEIGKND
jgi:hypothetical protein